MQTRSITCGLVLLIFCAHVRGAQVEIENLRLLAPESCYKSSPAKVIEDLEATGWFACETCIDHAMSVYAQHVRPLVDQRHRDVARIRPDLLAIVTELDSAVASVTGGNWFGHETARHPAHVEWFIIRVASDRADRDSIAYSDQDVVAVMEIWYRAHASANDEPPLTPKETYLARVNRALAALSRAEHHLTADQAKQLRSLIMRRIANWL